MKFVLDSCVALKWVLPEPDSIKAIQLRTEYRNRVHELIAPDDFVAEVAHALSRAERRGLIVPPEGENGLLDILRTPPKFASHITLIAEAYALSSLFRIGAYDCLYLALAEQEGCELITADTRLKTATKLPYVKLLSDLP